MGCHTSSIPEGIGLCSWCIERIIIGAWEQYCCCSLDPPICLMACHATTRIPTPFTQMPLGPLRQQVHAMAREWGFMEGSVEQVLLTEKLLGTGGEVRHWGRVEAINAHHYNLMPK